MEPQVPRISFTVPAINAAKRVVFLVTGESKREAVAARVRRRGSVEPGGPSASGGRAARAARPRRRSRERPIRGHRRRRDEDRRRLARRRRAVRVEPPAHRARGCRTSSSTSSRRRSSDARTEDTRAVGIGMPSLVEFETGRIASSVNIPLQDMPLRELLSERPGCRSTSTTTRAARRSPRRSTRTAG